MPQPVSLGPVFAFEWLTRSRRWQTFAARSLFVTGLLAALVAVWVARQDDQTKPVTLAAQAEVGVYFFYAIVGAQLALVLLVAPAATAGAICLEKSRGTLFHLFVTDLSNAEIVLGKLAARVMSAVAMLSCALPVMAIGTLIGGIDPDALTAAFLISLGTTLFACSLALALSVWGRKTPHVLLITYAVLLSWVLGDAMLYLFRWGTGLGWSLPEWATGLNPFLLAFAPYTRPGRTGYADVGRFLIVMLALSSGLMLLAVSSVRKVAIWQAGAHSKVTRSRSRRLAERLRHFLPGPSLERNPVAWYEWRRSRPSRWTIIFTLAYTTFSLIGLVAVVRAVVADSTWRNPAIHVAPSLLMGMSVTVGLLILSVTAPAAFSEERARGSLDLIMTTPLSTLAIYWGKWWGTFRLALMIAVAPTIAAVVIGFAYNEFAGPALLVGLVLAYGAGFTTLGIALATWFPRPSRAIAISVGVYILITIGWLLLVLMMGMGTGTLDGPGAASASPFMGTIFLLIQIQQKDLVEYQRTETAIWILFWILYYVLTTLGLVVANLATFNRCLGRMPLFDGSRRWWQFGRRPWNATGSSRPQPVVIERTSVAR